MVQKEIGIVLKVVDQATAGIKKTSADLSNFAKRNQENFAKMAQAWAVAFGAISAWIWLAIDKASSLWESVNAVNVVFWEWSKIIQEFGKESAIAVWLSAQSFNELATPIGAALQNVWLSADRAAQETIKLTKRAADMASVFNVDVRDALSAIQSWLRGEADPLERFWVQLNEASIKAYALKNWLIWSGKAMTDQEKATARLWLLYEQTARLEWDFANTSDQLANSKRILSAQMENISATIWTAFLPVIQQVVTAIRPVIDYVATRVQQNPELARNVMIVWLAITWLISVLWTIWLVLPAIISWVTALWTAFTFLTWPIWLVIAAVVLLGITIYKNWDLIKTKTKETFDFIVWVFQWDTEKIKALMEWMVRVLLWIMTLGMSELFISWAWWWDNVVNYVYSKVNPMVDWVKGKLDAIKWFVAGIKSAFDWAKSFVWSGISAVTNAVSWARAFGGTVQAGKSYLVWERWPEIITPASTSKVSNSVWGGMNISINMWGVTVTNSADENRLVDKITEALTRQSQLYQLGIN